METLQVNARARLALISGDVWNMSLPNSQQFS